MFVRHAVLLSLKEYNLPAMPDSGLSGETGISRIIITMSFLFHLTKEIEANIQISISEELIRTCGIDSDSSFTLDVSYTVAVRRLEIIGKEKGSYLLSWSWLSTAGGLYY